MSIVANTGMIYAITFNGADGSDTFNPVPVSVPGIEVGDIVIQLANLPDTSVTFYGSVDGVGNICSTADTLFQYSWIYTTNKGQDLTSKTYTILALRLTPVVS